MSRQQGAGQPPTAPEVICVGEAMAMIAPEQPEPLRTAEEFTIRAAGAESNVAMYLSALGHTVAWAGRVGDDPLGYRLLDEFAEGGIDLSLVERDQEAPTGVYFKDPGPAATRVFYYRSGSAATRMTDEVVGRMAALGPKLVHVSGIVPALSESCAQVTRALVEDRRLGITTISFDVNFRPGLWHPAEARDVLHDLAQAADIVFVGTDEAAEIWGVHTGSEIRDLFDRASIVLVKNGGNEATEYAGDAATAVPALRVRAVEPIGAGDAFAAGWLSAYLRGLPAVQRLRLGHVLAATAMQSMADFGAVPTPAVLESALSLSDTKWPDWSSSSGSAPGDVDRTASVAT